MPTLGSKRRTAPHNGRSNAAKRAAVAANKKRANNAAAAAAAAAKKERENYEIFLTAMSFVTPYRKKLERNEAFNNTAANIQRGNMMNIMYQGRYRMRPLGLTEQQWYRLAGVMNTIQRHPMHVRTNLIPIRNRFHATGRYTNANRNALIAWARSV